MKNRRLALVAFLLCACMIVGVGYAALAEELKIDGTASFHSSGTSELDEKIYFTGNTIIMGKDKNGASAELTTKDTDVVTINVTKGATTANLDVNLVAGTGAGTHADFINGNNYEVMVYFEFEVVATGKGNTLTVQFEDIAISGEVGKKGDFSVTSKVVNADTNKTDIAENKQVTITVPDDDADETVTQKFYLQVVVSLDKNTTEDINATEFHVVLPVTKVTL